MSTLDFAAGQVTEWVTSLKDDFGIDLADNAEKKCLHEAEEFADDPSLKEAADVFISLVAACHSKGWTPLQLAYAVNVKMQINWGRTWHRLPDGTWQHV